MNTLIKFTIPFIFNAQVIPKRCRKAQGKNFSDKVTVSVRAITRDQAPIAFEITDYQESVSQLLWVEDKLWTPLNYLVYNKPNEHISIEMLESFNKEIKYYGNPFIESDHIDKTSSATPYTPDWKEEFREWVNDDRAAKIVRAQSIAQDLLIIDGFLYKIGDEPIYTIYTFGLGNNHGGTSLSIDSCYNENISAENYFRADDYATACDRADAVAKSRGDSESIPVRPHSPITVLIPEAIKRNPLSDHGDGNPFINSIESGIETMGPIGGVLAAMTALNK